MSSVFDCAAAAQWPAHEQARHEGKPYTFQSCHSLVHASKSIEIGRETLEEPRHIEAVDERVVHLDGDRHRHAPALARATAEDDARNRVASTWQRVRE